MKFSLAPVCLLALVAPALGDDKDAKAALDLAIKAHGGADALAKAARLRRTAAGTLIIQGKPVAFTSTVTNDLPERQRVALELGRQKVVHVLDGTKAYANDGGATTTLLKQRIAELREEAYVDWAVTLVPLRDADVTLSFLGKSKRGDEAVVGVKAARKGRPTLSLYFAEKTGLLVNVAWRGGRTGTEVDKARAFSAHKEFDGVTLHAKEATSIDGKPFAEFTISGATFPAKADPKAFEKP